MKDFEWCTDCKEYDHEKHCCPRWTKVIRNTLDENTNVVLEDIRAEIEALPKTYPFINHIDTYVKEDDVLQIIEKYKTESEE